MFEVILAIILLAQLVYSAKLAVAKFESSYTQTEIRRKTGVNGDYSKYFRFYIRHHLISKITGFIVLNIAIIYAFTHHISLLTLIGATITYLILVKILQLFLTPMHKRENS